MNILFVNRMVSLFRRLCDTKDNSTNAWKIKHWFVELIDGFEEYYTS